LTDAPGRQRSGCGGRCYPLRITIPFVNKKLILFDNFPTKFALLNAEKQGGG
jgi:hypothetical protein